MTRLIAVLFVLFAVPALAEEPPRVWLGQWPGTDFGKSAVPFDEIISGGPGRDGIPAIDAPAMAPAAEVELPPREPVLTVELEGQAPRAYPIRYLIWHEIVNDRIGEVPVTITFCPLCNSALVFDGRLDGRELTFGITGMLRHSDMVMYDRQTESWWQQFGGVAIVGEMTGAALTALPSWMESWEAYRTRNPGGLAMLRPQSHQRAYGANPYRGYDGAERPFLYRGPAPPHGIAPLARVVRVGDRAWPLARLAEAGTIEEAGLRLEWREGQASALDSYVIAEGREVGDVRVYDAATGAPVVAEVVFAFAFDAFEPDGIWMLGE